MHSVVEHHAGLLSCTERDRQGVSRCIQRVVNNDAGPYLACGAEPCARYSGLMLRGQCMNPAASRSLKVTAKPGQCHVSRLATTLSSRARTAVPSTGLPRGSGGTQPDMPALLGAARKMTSAEPSVIALDIPLATSPFDSRRAADTAVSKAFGGSGCAVHSPTATRPGPLAGMLTEQLRGEGYPLATTAVTPLATPCAIEVYPHPALLVLLQRDYRIPYKVSRSGKYWPGAPVSERISNLLVEFREIALGLARVFGATPVPLPEDDTVTKLATLKRYEDALDALICAWVGLAYLRGAATAYGDNSAAIWIPSLQQELGV